ncbi:MAG: transcriptional repressor [Chloroflexi bacterium]|nr:transcriptional repressor [Chloroflexota bacterium]
MRGRGRRAPRGGSVVTQQHVETRVEAIVRKIRARGQRLTPQRLTVLRALVSSPHHPSADHIYREVAPTFPMMSPATVYKTIEVLKDLGEILELEFRDSANRYDANIPQPHPHVICTQCGRIQDLEVGDMDGLIATVAARTGYYRVRPRLDFYGLCPSCQSAREAHAHASGQPGQ